MNAENNLERSPKFTPSIPEPFVPLKDDELGVVLGRTAKRHAEFGKTGLGIIGRISEAGNDSPVYMDLLEPHVAVLVGVRGSGKSYSQGVIVEELGNSQLEIGTIVIDRCGVFSGLKVPNPCPKDCQKLEAMGLSPKAQSKVKVFTPGPERFGYNNLQLKTSEMTVNDWLQFWNIKTDGPQAALVHDLLRHVRRGYQPDKSSDRVSGYKEYDLIHMDSCLNDCEKIQSRYRPDTIRSLLQRISATESLELFDADGTSVSELSVPGQITVVDLSDPLIDENTAAKIVGMIARMVLRARQDSVREAVAHIPTTWLVIDEAHLYVGDTTQNGSAADLISYCKLGRRPGCALVLGTQQPSAMHKGVLSQADIVIAHQLVLDSDIDALQKIIPTTKPKSMFGANNLLRKLPAGIAIFADKLTQDRPVVVEVRRRETRHDGGSCLPGSLPSPESLSTKESPFLPDPVPCTPITRDVAGNDHVIEVEHMEMPIEQREYPIMKREPIKKRPGLQLMKVALYVAAFFAGMQAVKHGANIWLPEKAVLTEATTDQLEPIREEAPIHPEPKNEIVVAPETPHIQKNPSSSQSEFEPSVAQVAPNNVERVDGQADVHRIQRAFAKNSDSLSKLLEQE